MRRTSKSRVQRGAVAVEFALVLPLLLLLLLGMMDYGWYFFCRLSVTNAAREGARAGTTVPNGDADKAKTTAQAFINSAGLGAQNTTIDVSIGSNPTSVTVDVKMNFTPLVGFVTLPKENGTAVAKARAVMMGIP